MNKLQLRHLNTKSNDVHEKQMLAQKFIVELQYGNHVDTENAKNITGNLAILLQWNTMGFLGKSKIHWAISLFSSMALISWHCVVLP